MDRGPPDIGRSGAHKPDVVEKDYEKIFRDFINQGPRSVQSTVATANVHRQHVRADVADDDAESRNNQKHFLVGCFMVFVMFGLVCLVATYGIHRWFFTTAETARKAEGVKFVDLQCKEVCPFQYRLKLYANTSEKKIPANCPELWLNEEMKNGAMLIDEPRSSAETIENDARNEWYRPYPSCAPISGKFEQPWGEMKNVMLTLISRCGPYFCNREQKQWNDLLKYKTAHNNAFIASKTIWPVMYACMLHFLLSTLSVGGILYWTYKKLKKYTQQSSDNDASESDSVASNTSQITSCEKKSVSVDTLYSASDTSQKTPCEKKSVPVLTTPGSAKGQQGCSPTLIKRRGKPKNHAETS